MTGLLIKRGYYDTDTERDGYMREWKDDGHLQA